MYSPTSNLTILKLKLLHQILLLQNSIFLWLCTIAMTTRRSDASVTQYIIAYYESPVQASRSCLCLPSCRYWFPKDPKYASSNFHPLLYLIHVAFRRQFTGPCLIVTTHQNHLRLHCELSLNSSSKSVHC